jgi:phage-related minor tail protein
MFPMPGGRRGMMGEAGPEGVFPLTRTPGGDLGVRGQVAPVNIIVNDMRQRGEPVQVSESAGRDGTRQLHITIRDAIRAIDAEGGLDPLFKRHGLQGAYR